MEKELWLVDSKKRRTNTTIMLDVRIKKIMRRDFQGEMSDRINLLLKNWLESEGYSVQ